ncbi:hypothetical protein LHJ74_29120 [Streptomyces sp. N2-109]|uniref:Uncharacterized protein n=1 Tax=Streptomyces gossypii TaxID=2883101 RepID=A0ABT2K1R0_9ACTN|nr:hypothetical protein [Streptomyces gossypii]MCT2593921.1 hypothetical protein [Streptomyces gossypii]
MKSAAEKSPAGERGAPPAQRTPSADGPAAARTSAPAPVSGKRPPDLRSLQRLQGAAGNAAVVRLVAQRYTEPVKPSPAEAPGFRAVRSDVSAKRSKLAHHPPATGESKAAQDAALAPSDDKEAQGKVANAEKMNAAKPGEFDKQSFIDAVNKAIADQAPKNLEEAEKFSESGKAEQVKESVDGKVSDGKKTSAEDIDTETKAAPDTSAAKEKQVTPMTPDQPPANPGAPSADDAIPDKQPPEVTDFTEGPKQNDQAMADAEITEEQLAKGNEPQFDEALSEKKKAEDHSKKAPAQGKTAESAQLADAKSHAAASGTQAMEALTTTRDAAGKKVDSGKGEAKTKDEKQREKVTAKLQKVFDATKKDVESTLDGLDKKVDDQFTKGEKAAHDAFTADQKKRIDKYKDKRYSGFTGKMRWVKDKFKGLPEEANELYQISRKLYVNKMQQVISSIADTIGRELGKAKTRIAKGRTELKAEVEKLPDDLKKYGQEAVKDFAGKFDDLEADVNAKSQELVQTLATKYTQALNKIDEEIKKLQEANKGWIAKAKDAIVGAIQTIMELKDLLMGILAKAAGAITKIIKDPIGFLKNLVTAVGGGLDLFTKNIEEHLKKGLVSWLLGTAVKSGIEIPDKFDLKGVIQLIGSMLGLTWDNVREKIIRKGVPEKAMSKVEESVPAAQALAKEGPSGLTEQISAETGDVKKSILDELKSYLIPTVIIAGITWIVSLLNPASAFVRAVKGIIEIVTFIVQQGAQIIAFVNAVLDAVVAIANGGTAGVPPMVETALAASIPLLIGFLAALLGVGGLASKVKSVIQKVSKPVGRAIDKIITKIAQKGKKLWRKLKGKDKDKKKGDDKDNKDKDNKDKDEKATVVGDLSLSQSTDMAGEGHTVYVEVKQRRVHIEMASQRREWIGSLITSALEHEEAGQKRSDLLEYLNGMDTQVKAMKRTGAGQLTQTKKDRIERQLIEITRALNLLGHAFGMKDLRDFTKSKYTANGQLLDDYRNGTAIRATFYPGWNSAAQNEKRRQLKEHTNRLIAERATWDPNGTHTGSNWYICPGNGTRSPHLADKSTSTGLAAIDHNQEVSSHWNTEGHNTPHPPRETWYNNISNHVTMCTSCNGSKGGPGFELDVGPNFRGPGDPP